MTLINKLFRAMDIIAKVIMVFIAAGFVFSRSYFKNMRINRSFFSVYGA